MIVASQAGDSSYFAAPDVNQSFNVNPDSDGDGVGDTTDLDVDGDGLIEISSLADLDEMRNDLAGSSLYGVSTGCPAGGCFGYELTAELDFDTNSDGVLDSNDDYWNGGAGWVPVGNFVAAFSAAFNGNGFVIRNLLVNLPGTNDVGLFGQVSGGELTNIQLSGSLTSVTGNQDTGILVGGVYDATIISDCYTSGAVNAYSGGGLVGSLYSGTIATSFSTATVTGSGYQNGGLVGASYGSGTIENSFAAGAVTGTTSIGGLVGALYTGAVVDNSHAVGSVTGDSDTGGLAGLVYTPTVTDSYWDMETTGQATTAGGLGAGLTTVEMQCPVGSNDTGCKSGTTLYEGWDPAVWDFGTDSQYPVLILNGQIYRDSDGDGIWDFEDTSSSFPWTMFLPAIIGNRD